MIPHVQRSILQISGSLEACECNILSLCITKYNSFFLGMCKFDSYRRNVHQK